jgi:hypothetical protein
VVCSLQTSVSATDQGNFLEHSSDITSTADGVFLGITDQIIMGDVFLCYNYTAILFWNGVDSFKYMFIDGYLAVESIGLIVHKTPLVYNQCIRTIDDEKFMEFVFSLYNNYNAKVYLNMYYRLYLNFIFNFGDVIQNMYDAETNLKARNFTSFGRNIGRIVTDLFYHNPVDNKHWSEEMSVTVTKPGQTKKIESKYYKSLEVNAENPASESLIGIATNLIDQVKKISAASSSLKSIKTNESDDFNL